MTPKIETQVLSNPITSRRTLGSWWRIILIVAIVALLLIAGSLLNLDRHLRSLLEWTQSINRLYGMTVLAGIYILACVLFLPGSILTLAAGALFGLLYGTIAVSIGSTLGACAAFLVGRTIARGWVERKVSEHPTFEAIDRAVAREGLKVVFLTRLSPIFPFNLLNYAFGLTKVSFWKYALASWIGMLPGTVMYVYLGSAAGELAQALTGDVEGGIGSKILFGLGLVATVVVVILVTRVARKALKQELPSKGSMKTKVA